MIRRAKTCFYFVSCLQASISFPVHLLTNSGNHESLIHAVYKMKQDFNTNHTKNYAINSTLAKMLIDLIFTCTMLQRFFNSKQCP
jgi:hypothetical protein